MRLWETAGGMLNSIGLQNIGVDAVLRDKAPVWATWEVPVLVNVSGSTVQEYVEIVRRLDGAPGVAGIELNVSCPNIEAGGIAFGRSPDLLADVTRAVRAATGLPLIVKLSPNVEDIRCLARAAQDAGADAVALINTVFGMAIDVSKRSPALSNVMGGLSGPAIKPYALYFVYQAAQEVSIPVIGYGGIMSACDAIEFMMAGASAIGIATALLVNPRAGQVIVSGVETWCRREGLADIGEIVGAANPRFKGIAHSKRPAESVPGGSFA
ncbi:MAG: hypothetical protein NVS2B16_06090 [Chloroflexota bacterium]